MSKTVYLLGRDLSVLAFGPGCTISRRFEGTRWWVTGDQLGLSVHVTEDGAKSAIAVWLQAIIGAPDGALLRWDYDRQCVVDELAPDEEVFVDELDGFATIERAA